jgi:hypothetical protein
MATRPGPADKKRGLHAAVPMVLKAEMWRAMVPHAGEAVRREISLHKMPFRVPRFLAFLQERVILRRSL